MRARVLSIAFFLILSSTVHTDSIKIKGVTHEDVYIKRSKSFYFVHFPDEGRVEKISRVRRDISDVLISTDEVERRTLLDRYHESAKRAERLPMETTESNATTVKVDDHQELQNLQSLLLFETQLSHWQQLSPDERSFLQYKLVASFQADSQSRIESKSKVSERLGGAYDERDKTRGELVRSVEEYKRKVRNAEDRRAQSAIADYLRKSRVSTESLEKKAAAKEFIEEATDGLNELDETEKRIRQQERDLLIADQNAFNTRQRYGAQQERLDQLSEADLANYQPELVLESNSIWYSEITQRSNPFTIDREVWLLNCDQKGLAQQSRNFSITIFDAKTNLPFTQISDVDFLHMRTRVLRGPGEFYLEIEHGSDAPCKIEALELVQ